MSTKTLLLALLAVGLYVTLKRGPSLRVRSGSAAHAGLPATGAESPNAAERLQVTHAQGAFAGIGDALPASTATGPEARLFNRPNVQDDPIVPGLPDQFRGA